MTKGNIIMFLGHERAETASHCLIHPNDKGAWDSFLLPCTVYLMNMVLHKNEPRYKSLRVTRGRKLKTGHNIGRRANEFCRTVCSEIVLYKRQQLNTTRQQLFTFFDNTHNMKLVLTEYDMATPIWLLQEHAELFCYSVFRSNTTYYRTYHLLCNFKPFR